MHHFIQNVWLQVEGKNILAHTYNKWGPESK
jgi:hypothetical protein